MEAHLANPVAEGSDIAHALGKVADAINRLADAYLYVNQPEDEPAFEGQSLSDREHL